MSMIPMGGHKIAPNPALIESDPDTYLSMGLTAENLAREFGIRREEQDAFALESHRKALAAIDAGRFKDEIVSLPVREVVLEQSRRTVCEFNFATDEGPRRDTSMEALQNLKQRRADHFTLACHDCPPSRRYTSCATTKSLPSMPSPRQAFIISLAAAASAETRRSLAIRQRSTLASPPACSIERADPSGR